MEKTPNYDHELVVPIDRNGGKETIRIREIDYPVYKAAKQYFKTDTEKAVMIMLKDVTIEEDKSKLSIFDGKNLVAMLAIEDLLGQLVEPIQGEIKKNSTSTK